jgi:hypothetical protein
MADPAKVTIASNGDQVSYTPGDGETVVFAVGRGVFRGTLTCRRDPPAGVLMPSVMQTLTSDGHSASDLDWRFMVPALGATYTVVAGPDALGNDFSGSIPVTLTGS